MGQMSSRHSRSAIAAALLAALASFALAACGSSSTGTSSTTSSTTATGTKEAFASLRFCLAKEGIVLPPNSLPKGAASEPTLPAGVTRQQFQQATKSCLGLGEKVPNLGGTKVSKNSPAYKAALQKFATCMRQQGIPTPEPNTSGNGPVFPINPQNLKNSKYPKAIVACGPFLPTSKSIPPPNIPLPKPAG